MKALAALGIVVTGAVAAFAVYTFGWRESDGDDQMPLGSATRKYVYTIHPGDVIRVPAAATRCIASQEGGFPNLYCTRTPRGRYRFVFYKDSVLVWGPGGPEVTGPRQMAVVPVV